VQLARETLRRHDDARSFVRALFATSVNLRPDSARNELRVEIHGQANPIHDATLEALCAELNATEICYPGTTLRLVYRPIRSSISLRVRMSEKREQTSRVERDSLPTGSPAVRRGGSRVRLGSVALLK